MPPASLSTFEVMMPGPMTARKSAMRRRQFLPREKKAKTWPRRRSMKALMEERVMRRRSVTRDRRPGGTQPQGPWQRQRFLGHGRQGCRETPTMARMKDRYWSGAGGAGSCIHQAGDDVVDGNGADGTVVVTENGEHAQIVFVEEFEDVFLAGVSGDGYERIGFEFGHTLFGGGQKNARDGGGAGEMAELIDENDGVELFELEFLAAKPR